MDRDVGRGLVDRLHELVHADLGSAATGGDLTHERADVGQAIEIGRDGQVAAGFGGHVGGHAIRAYSAGARLTNWPWPLRPVNVPSRTMTEPRDSTTSLEPWTVRPS